MSPIRSGKLPIRPRRSRRDRERLRSVMAIRKIVALGQDDVLRGHARPIAQFDEGLCALLDDMAETMIGTGGIGLAAPQIGEPLRCAVIDTASPAEGVDAEPCILELINPEIVSSEGQMTVIESCLSVPGRAGRVVRPERVKVRALDRTGKPFEIEGEDMLAACLCHEIDHLDGIVYVDRMIEDCTEMFRQNGVLS